MLAFPHLSAAKELRLERGDALPRIRNVAAKRKRRAGPEMTLSGSD